MSFQATKKSEVHHHRHWAPRLTTTAVTTAASVEEDRLPFVPQTGQNLTETVVGRWKKSPRRTPNNRISNSSTSEMAGRRWPRRTRGNKRVLAASITTTATAAFSNSRLIPLQATIIIIIAITN